ncbi:MAG: hypothetical protein V9G42_14110 [Bacteroidia bacterium]
MKNKHAIQKIDKILSYHYHFTDWEFGGGNDFTGEKCPRPEKTEWLVELFKLKMNRLKDFLNANSNTLDLERFILQEVTSLDSTQFFKREYELFVGKYGELPYWLLNCKVANNFLQENRDKLIYADSSKG